MGLTLKNHKFWGRARSLHYHFSIENKFPKAGVSKQDHYRIHVGPTARTGISQLRLSVVSAVHTAVNLPAGPAGKAGAGSWKSAAQYCAAAQYARFLSLSVVFWMGPVYGASAHERGGNSGMALKLSCCCCWYQFWNGPDFWKSQLLKLARRCSYKLTTVNCDPILKINCN